MKTITVKIDDDIHKLFFNICSFVDTSMAEELRRLILMDIECCKEVYADDKDFFEVFGGPL